MKQITGRLPAPGEMADEKKGKRIPLEGLPKGDLPFLVPFFKANVVKYEIKYTVCKALGEKEGEFHASAGN